MFSEKQRGSRRCLRELSQDARIGGERAEAGHVVDLPVKDFGSGILRERLILL